MANDQANSLRLDATLKLTVLGGASISYVLPNQELTQVLGPGKPLALLVYLAHLPNRTATRDHVLDLLWSNQVPSLAKPALRQAIWYIRQRIGNAGIASGDGMIKLAVPVESDSDRFETAVDDGDLERAVGLYGGPFLPDLAIPGGAEFEHWANAERARLESMFLRTSEVVIRSWLSQGQFQKAEKLARTVRDMNRLRQAWWRLLLEVLTSSGDAVRATVVASELERILETEEVQPDLATAEAIRLARQMPATVSEPASGRTLVAELVGREREFAVIIRAWNEAKTGAGRHLTITGGAGIGKSRLLTDVHMRLHASGVQIVHLRANVGERQIDYSLASNLAGALSQFPGSKGIPPACASTLVALNPSLSTLYEATAESIKDSDVLRTRTIALCELLAAVAHEQPIAVLIDDLHWSDEASRNLLGGFAGCLRDNPALMISASRPSVRGPLQDSAQEEITLRPLTAEHVFALVSSIGTLPEADWVKPALRSLREGNGGSPLLVLESLQLALDRGSLELCKAGWACSDGDTLVAEFEQGGALRSRVAKLGRSESWVLLILAVAGMPVSVIQLAKMTGRSEKSLHPAVMALEQRGFVARVESELEPAHDEIGALAIELPAEDAVSAARGSVGRVLAEEAADNDHLLLRAGQLLASAEDRGRLNEVFRKRLWLARNRGDYRCSRDLARELLGTRYSAEESKALFKSLPLYFRLGLTSVRRITAVAAVVILALGATATALLWPEGRPPDISLIAYDRTAGPFGQPLGAAVRRDNFSSQAPLELRRTAVAPRIDSIHGRPVASPDGNSWAFNRLQPDSGEIDVFVIDGHGNERRLTNTPNDDAVHDWSPDGRHLLIVSSRWDPDEMYEAATIELATGAVSRLTHSPQSESDLKWSPDGTRIGFLRTDLGAQTNELCWTTPQADPAVCVREVSSFSGWDEPQTVLVTIDSAETSYFGRLNIEDGRFQSIIPLGTNRRLYSARDGKWILGLYGDSVSGGAVWKLFPTDAPELAKDVILPTSNIDGYELALRPTSPHQRHLDVLKIDSLARTLPVGIPSLLSASGLDNAGGRVPLPRPDWRGTDTAVASIDRRGVFYPRRPGITMIHATVGGWREDSMMIEVTGAAAQDVFLEDWSDDWITGWDPYGDPAPVVTVGPDSLVGFWNNADLSFTSGAFTRHEWSVHGGLGVEALISTTITNAPQQTLSLAFAGWMDSVAIAAWNHVEGYLPGRSSDSRPEHCAIAYPNTNAVLDGEIAIQVGRHIDYISTGLVFDTGKWHRVVVQIFPDGTCGVAINGRAIARTTVRVPLDRPYRLWTEGRSTGSEMIVGPLEVWTGVRSDVDWSALDWPP